MSIKTFKRYIREETEKYYTLNLTTDMTKQDAVFYMNQFLPIILKMLKNTDVMITAEPVIDGEEE